jgi:signal transduction histidine kinase
MQTRDENISQRKRRLAWMIVGAIALIILSIAMLLIASIVKLRQAALDEARLRASYLSAALQEDVEGVLNTAAVASEFVKRRVEAEGGAAPLAEFKQSIAKHMPALVTISVIGPDGNLLATSGDVASSLASFSQFEFFIANRDNPSSGFRIGKPVAGLVPGRIIVPETQRLENKEGGFAGVLLFSMDPARATALYHQVELGNSGSLLIASADGTVFGGYVLPRGLDPSIIGQDFADNEVMAHLQGAPSGSINAVSQIDGIARVYSWRRLEDFPLIAVVGLGKAEALAGANRQAAWLSGFAIFAATLLLALTAMLGREISRRTKQALALETSRRTLKEMNAECVSAKRQAEQASRSKSFFLANIGHELRTPLTAIICFAEIIKDKVFGNDPDRYAGYASDIYGSATHLLQLIGNLLDWSKIEAGKFELHERLVNLTEIEEGCLHLIRGEAENCGIELVSSPTGPAISLHADETALKQVLLNMLSNAIKFTPKGGSVWLSHSLEPDGTLTLTVTDTGVGMTEEEIQKALEPFQQVQNPLLRHREGTGLGLPLAAQLMVLHGGSLTIESHPGQGTAVLVHFPAWRVNPDREGSTPPAQDGDAPAAKKVTRPARKH